MATSPIAIFLGTTCVDITSLGGQGINQVHVSVHRPAGAMVARKTSNLEVVGSTPTLGAFLAFSRIDSCTVMTAPTEQ